MNYIECYGMMKRAALSADELEEDFNQLRKLAPKTYAAAVEELKANKIDDPVKYMHESADGVGPVLTKGTWVNEFMTHKFNKLHRGFGAAAYLHDAFCMMPYDSDARRRAQYYLDRVLTESGARKAHPKWAWTMGKATYLNDTVRHHLTPLKTAYKAVVQQPVEILAQDVKQIAKA